ENIYTSTTLQVQKTLPKNLGILGAGNIGLEYASIYQGFGSQVTMMDTEEQILGKEEPEMANEVQHVLEDKGINIHTGLEITKVSNKGQEVIVSSKDGTELSFDALLIATGRKPAIDDLNLENTKIQLTENKGIQTNEHLETNIEKIFALGDVRGEEQFTY